MEQLHLSSINYLAVLAAWIVHVVLGLIWFRPALFGNEWSKLTGRELKPAKQWLIPGLLGHLLMILALVVLIKLTRATTGVQGVFIGLLAWIGHFRQPHPLVFLTHGEKEVTEALAKTLKESGEFSVFTPALHDTWQSEISNPS